MFGGAAIVALLGIPFGAKIQCCVCTLLEIRDVMMFAEAVFTDVRSVYRDLEQNVFSAESAHKSERQSVPGPGFSLGGGSTSRSTEKRILQCEKLARQEQMRFFRFTSVSFGADTERAHLINDC